MIENDENYYFLSKSSVTYFPVWVAKASCFIRIPLKHLVHRWKRNHWVESMPRIEQDSGKLSKALYFKYYEMLWDRKQEMDVKHGNLGCARSRWHITSTESDVLLTARELGMIPAVPMRGTGHTVPQNTMILLTGREYPPAKAHFSVCEETDRWKNEQFFCEQVLCRRTWNVLVPRDKKSERNSQVLAYLAIMIVHIVEISCILKSITATGSKCVWIGARESVAEEIG